MNTEKQRIAIARACGEDNDSIVRELIPDYLNDLNAMYEAEATMNLTDKYQYGKAICKIMNMDTEGGLDVVDIYYACHASAAQRAEAFLRTIGEWEITK